VGPPVIAESDPHCEGACRALLGLEAMAMDTLLFERPNDRLDHSVLLRTVRGDELLPEAVAEDELCVLARRKDQSIVGAEQEWSRHLAEGPKAREEGVLQRCASPSRSARAASR
jgi:hypothetical protein